MEYESDILKRLIDTYGVVGNPRYISEIIKEFIVQGKERYPELFTYQADWLAHIDEFGLNPSYTVSYTGQSIYAPNTLERPVKSAILKGQTLVNLAPKKIIDYTASSDWDGFDMLVQNSTQSSDQWRTLQDLKPNTRYYISCYVETFEDVNGRDYYLNNSSYNCLFVDSMQVNGVGHFQWISRTKSELTDEIFIALRCQNAYARGAIKIRDIMIIEYVDGMENWDIPYFEGMQSVKMPVLKATGKNLFDVNKVTAEADCGFIPKVETNGVISFTGIPTRSYGSWATDIYLKPSTYSVKILVNGVENKSNTRIWFRDKNGVKLLGNMLSGTTFTAKEDVRVFVVLEGYTVGENIGNVKVQYQIEENNIATSYEPYKSNILSCLEPVELGSVGEVKDELSPLTQQLTQRTETRPYQEGDELNSEFVTDMTNTRYKLAQEVVKTVDLTIQNQNGQIVKQLMSFNGGTHFNTGSLEGTPLPSVSVSVETDLEETLKVCSLEGYTM